MVDDRISDEAPWLKIDFRREGNSVEYVNEGWNGPEAYHNWALGQTSFLTIDRIPERGALLARLDVWPFVAPPVLPRQRLDVSVNGVRLAQLEVGGRKVFEFRIPENAFRPQGLLRFRFDHPDAARPIDLMETTDGRVLSLAFVELSLYAASEVAQTESTPLEETLIASRSVLEPADRTGLLSPSRTTNEAADFQASSAESATSDTTDLRRVAADSSGVATIGHAVPPKMPEQDTGEGLIAKFTSLFRSRR